MPWDRIRVRGPNARRALIAGFVAMLVLTGLMYLGVAVGVTIRNIPSYIAAAISFNAPLADNQPYYLWGGALYFIFTVIMFPLCYCYWIYSYMPGPDWFRGTLFGAFLWFLVEALVMPLIGSGFFDFHGRDTAPEIISQLIMWLAYGAVLGFIAGPQEVWKQAHHQELSA